jgi:hypothetical protein
MALALSPEPPPIRMRVFGSLYLYTGTLCRPFLCVKEFFHAYIFRAVRIDPSCNVGGKLYNLSAALGLL